MKIKNSFINILKYILFNILLLYIIYLAYLINIRICLIYKLFKIPCPGCGLTNSVIYLINGNILKSLQYNIITIPLIVIYIICSCWYIIDMLSDKQTLKKVISENNKKIIVVSIIIFIISFIKNLTNPLLY